MDPRVGKGLLHFQGKLRNFSVYQALKLHFQGVPLPLQAAPDRLNLLQPALRCLQNPLPVKQERLCKAQIFQDHAPLRELFFIPRLSPLHFGARRLQTGLLLFCILQIALQLPQKLPCALQLLFQSRPFARCLLLLLFIPGPADLQEAGRIFAHHVPGQVFPIAAVKFPL